jgi:glyoxylase-like metal-dependent hydrolase (beta-lactamase superfamily II)
MAQQIPLDPDALLHGPSEEEAPGGRAGDIAADLAYRRLAIANVMFFGQPGAGDREWVLIDAGIPWSAPWIARAALARFGTASRPAAIVLTHGHFDHVGALPSLAERWDVPVFAHPLEHPFLNGTSPYPPPDPTVGGGLMSRLSILYPRGPIDLGSRLRALPEDGHVPGMPGWAWIHTPGHSPGHISLWRDADRSLIAGDAFVTTRQESAYAVAVQAPEMHGPPMYYTTDWEEAHASVESLAALEPAAIITGHGRPIGGPGARSALRRLASDFRRCSIPQQGRYVPRVSR